MKATVLIRPKEGILDPQGEAVEASLAHLGFAVTGARVGRLVDVELDDGRPGGSARRARPDVAELLANPLIESFTIELGGRAMSRARPRIAVVTFPGSNDDGDAVLALELLGAEPVRVWHADDRLPTDIAGVVLPGGFSYGDYLRCGAIARFAPVMEAVRAFAAAGGPVLGICNGFQILCEAGLLAGRAAPEPPAAVRLRGRDRDRRERRGRRSPPRLASGDELVIPVKHGEGNWFVDDDLYAELASAARSCSATPRTSTARATGSRASRTTRATCSA